MHLDSGKEKGPAIAANNHTGEEQRANHNIPPLISAHQVARRNLRAEAEATYIKAGTDWLRLTPLYWLGYTV